MAALNGVLIVEDDYFIANELARGLADAGLDIVGPVPSLARALAAIDGQAIGGAVLDIDLNGEPVYAVADALLARDVPLVFVTGYARSNLPDRFDAVPLCRKPVASAKVRDALDRAAAPRGASPADSGDVPPADDGARCI